MAISLGVKQARHEANCSPLPSAEIKNEWSYTSTPLICRHGVDRDDLKTSIFFLSSSFDTLGVSYNCTRR